MIWDVKHLLSFFIGDSYFVHKPVLFHLIVVEDYLVLFVVIFYAGMDFAYG